MGNQTFEKLKGIPGILLAVLFVVSLTAISAGAESALSCKETGIKSVSPIQCNEPNLFVLHGVEQKYRDVNISYSKTSLIGQPILTYEDSNSTRSFMGDAIRTQETEIGTMVTVTLEAVPDLRVVTLTLLVPEINLDGSAREFETIAILTTTKTTIGGPGLVKGALQSYEVIDLNGTACCVVS